jgi:hypothetical protein
LGEGIHSILFQAFHFFGEYFIETLDQISFYPMIYIKSDLVETQAEVAVRAEWGNVATAGVGYRGFGQKNVDALIISAGLRLSPDFTCIMPMILGLAVLAQRTRGLMN